MKVLGNGDARLNSKFARIYAFTILTFLTFLLTTVFANLGAHASKQPGQDVFQQARTEFDKLVSAKNASRQSWLAVARKFRSFHKKSGGQESRLSLFYSGRALIESYKTYGEAPDLESGINALNEFKKVRIGAPYDNQVLVELKDAHLLKRKAHPKQMTLARSRSTESQTSSSENKRLNRGEETVFKAPSVSDMSDPAANNVSRPGKETINALESRPPLTRFGNPFYNVLPLNGARRKVAEVRTASLPPQVVTDTKPISTKTSEPKSDTRVIVLDPGHGGKDPGAVSKDGSLTEKEVTLRIARKLKRLLEKRIPNLTVTLTRDDDAFLSLKERTAIANAANADLFISIHCNGSEYSSASGVETFFLSQANSRGAMRAAARENGISLTKMNHLEATLIDLMMTSKRTESEKLAEIIHESLMDAGNRKSVKARDRGVKQAPFYVLMGAAMPAILVECAFISNMSEKNNLKNEHYVDSIAEKLSSGAKKYFSDLGQNS